MKIKNWSKFQHFKDRKPPWIKLYRDLLDDLNWHELDPVAAKSLVALWLIASEYEGALPDIKTLAFRLRLPEKSIKSIVSKLSPWLDQVDISAISDDSAISGRYQDDISVKALTRSQETEREGETETYKPETEGAHKCAELAEPRIDDWIPKAEWEAYCQHRGSKFTPTAKRLAIAKLRVWRDAGYDVAAILNESVMNGWKGLFEPKGKGRMPDLVSGLGPHGQATAAAGKAWLESTMEQT